MITNADRSPKEGSLKSPRVLPEHLKPRKCRTLRHSKGAARHPHRIRHPPRTRQAREHRGLFPLGLSRRPHLRKGAASHRMRLSRRELTHQGKPRYCRGLTHRAAALTVRRAPPICPVSRHKALFTHRRRGAVYRVHSHVPPQGPVPPEGPVPPVRPEYPRPPDIPVRPVCPVRPGHRVDL